MPTSSRQNIRTNKPTLNDTDAQRPDHDDVYENDLDQQSAEQAVDMLGALAHMGRLKLMRRLIQAGENGLSAGELSRFAATAPPTTTAQLQVLYHAKLVSSRRLGRQIIYSANYPEMSELLRFLMADCCCANQEICGPEIASIMAHDTASNPANQTTQP